MEVLGNYIIQSGLCLLLFYLFYVSVLRSYPKPAYNRVYLLAAPVAALVFPLIDLPLPFVPQYNLAPALSAIPLAEVTITGYVPDGQASTGFIVPPTLIVSVLYSLVAFALLTRLGVQLFRLKKLVDTANPINTIDTTATVLQTGNNYPTFAFLNYIFVNHQHHLTDQEKQQVIAHELAHVRLRHTYDVLYYELLTALLWFNPLIWLLKTELRDVHEYQADAAVIAVYQPQAYTTLLAKEALYKTGIPVGSYFQKPQVFKRLHMLQKNGQKTGVLRPLLVLPLLLAMLFIFSSKDVTADMMPSLTKPETQTAQPEQVQTIAEAPQQIPEVMVTAKTPEKALPATKPEQAVEKPIVTENLPQPETEPNAEKPYEFVEQMPQFAGGELEMQKFIARSIRYPKTTKEAGIAGLVVASFIVEPDGSLSNITILKGLDEAADQEARRVIEAMSGKWEPGKQNGNVVPVRFTIPIRFALVN
ncbi:TonB family protein [Pontibacter sp. BT310]|uniref:TonB family protein n=1 Tax=Pontibacter populi TaxID=890055 RepID=A0ABS6XDB2_9BACT|nr:MULTISPECIES: M56 family metallopeptidase [Pontibacter]MBJ6118639.1 TonB family protein [Pontibacter sp. BT310]MBR0571068.1 TonB family protein [Microvirga sp. STS03]MBW3365493.1 TonB family protein [Pontibacter populi]